MSGKQSMFKNKSFIITLSFVLVFALCACVFGIEYASVARENKAVGSELEQLRSERDEMASGKAEAEKTASDLNQQVNDLNSKINQLNSDIAYIKATKAKANSSKNTVSGSTAGTAAPQVDLSKLTAPNEGYRVCYLTFDDGPSDNTLKILAVLKQANAKASFFVKGTAKIEYIKQEHEQGHTVALHTNSHDYPSIYKNETNFFNDLTAVQNKVKSITGETATIIRFPGGSSNTVSKKHNKGIMTRLTKQVQEKGFTYVDWNVDSGDADGNGIAVSKLLSNVAKQSRGKGDICVLMHDTNAKSTTVQALPQIICYLRAQGYRFEALTKDSPTFHHGVNN